MKTIIIILKMTNYLIITDLNEKIKLNNLPIEPK